METRIPHRVEGKDPAPVRVGTGEIPEFAGTLAAASPIANEAAVGVEDRDSLRPSVGNEQASVGKLVDARDSFERGGRSAVEVADFKTRFEGEPMEWERSGVGVGGALATRGEEDREQAGKGGRTSLQADSGTVAGAGRGHMQIQVRVESSVLVH